MHTERMALTHTYISFYIYIFREYNFYCMTLRLLVLPHPVYHHVYVVKHILTRRGGSKSFKMMTRGGLVFQTLNYPEKLWENHSNVFSDALAFFSPAGHVLHYSCGACPAIDSLPSIRPDTLIRSPSVVYSVHSHLFLRSLGFTGPVSVHSH